MNLQEALDTSEWLLRYTYSAELSPNQILQVRKLRDVLYYLHAAAGITEIRITAYELGQGHEHREYDEDED